ncbi:hypothetical protein J5Y03_10070 [Bacillus sp. RG28]|uniref:Uncharacterized protein n=1 Tax=Gottfriedia endophytica TaxID=2820819 RepID=A0A940NV93_9BACI|nr:hypothetical protein [Gottfriedia endophytica]MBP0725533.1 hypothetical protein [Gottfriedia endophytica]
MMYWYWKKKGIRPSFFFELPRGEMAIISAFFEEELKEEVEKRKAMSEGSICPGMLGW